ncbi:uncharacterized protein NECHADRAFT_82305 [Fusarium vanettenii 77-13-4]|uniref:Rhodopsin domain-containing protein n=1 Tax=Fusarium vanettenii (strain ATCC MYA-4622 / CBS 123669 / FGSC 9596 / NRRL 45880 / 77-13-4) TaxID=660122 RepID=C7ZQ48_FUSV7|nr:uncharacterized protein NECHADRAFT_82305 [Fusarium vanettenii 77-13-4]EEU33867.1 hypothetical protein NECHADRAFT_82305 [Fusarium vanettenii 77-13-4]
MAAPSTAGALACFWILLCASAILIAARLWLRLKIQHQALLLSDALLLIAWCSSLTHAVFVIIFAVKGALHPDIDYTLINWKVNVTEVEFITRMIWSSVFPFFTSLYFCKFALLATYLQLFPRFMKKLRVALYVAIAYCVSGYLVSMSVQLFLCWPIEGNWSFASNPAVVCEPKIIGTIFYIAWSLHFTANLSIIILPFFILKNLQVKKKTMVGIYAIFSLGIIDIAFSLTRFLTIHLGSGGFKPLTLIQIWSILDENMALIIACLPSLRPYLRHGFKSSSAEASYGYGNRSTGHITSTRKTQATSGFEVIDDPVPVFDGGLHRNTRRGNDSEDDAWSDGKKSNRSDIELVTIQAQRGDRTSTVHQGQIRVEQGFIVTR